MDRDRVVRLTDEIYDRIEDPAWRIRAISHSHAVASLAALLARVRGLDAELAAVCGQMHDLAAYERLSYDNHAAFGAERAVQFLRELGEQDEAALCLVHSAILRHDDLGKTDGPMDEVLKDADLLDNAQLRAPEKLRPEEIKRLCRVFEELGIRQNPYGAGQATVPNSI